MTTSTSSPFKDEEYINYIRNNYSSTYELTQSEALTYAAGMGASDTARGISQMFSNAIGWDEASEALKKEDDKLREIFEHPEFGTEAMVAFLSSAIVADPGTYVPIVGWLAKGKKAKTLYDFTKYGVAGGAAVSAAGYVPEDLAGFVVDKDSSTLAKRAEYAAIGAIGGGAIASVGGKIADKIQVARGKGSIFGEPDELLSKTSSTDIPPVASAEPLKLGQTVKAPDRNNVGTIMAIDEESGTAILRFVNKKNGTSATKKFTIDELQPPKPGQAKQTPQNVKGDTTATQSKEIKFIVDDKTNPKHLLYKTVDKLTGKMYTIKRAVNEQNKVIKGQWEILVQRRKKVKVKGQNRKQTKVVYEDTKIAGSLEESKAWVKQNIQGTTSPETAAPSKIVERLLDDAAIPNKEPPKYKNSLIQQYQDLMGTPIKNAVFNNIGESLSGVGGYTYGYSSVDDPNATYSQKVATGLVYATVFAGGVKGIKKVDKQFNENRFTDLISRGVIDGYKLDDSYLLLRQDFRNEKNTIGHKFLEIQQEIQEKLSPEDNKLLWQFMVGEIDDISPELLSINNKARKKITDYAQELVDLGLLDEKVYKKNIDTYLKSSYLKHKKQKGTRVFDTNNQIRLIGDELKLKGMTDEVSVKAFNNPESVWQKEGWEVIKELKGDKLKVRRHYTKKERVDMEEIEDASYALAETGRLFANDIATGRFFNKLSKQFGIDEADYKMLPDIDKKNYEKLGEEFIKGTNKPKYGGLSGMYVPREVATDVKHIFSFATEGENIGKVVGRDLNKLQTLWKKTKTAWNPATHVANSASNVMLLDFAGTKLKYLSRAIKEMYKGDKSPINVQAKIAGIYDVNLINKELNNSLSAIEKSMQDLQTAPFGTGIIGYSKSVFKVAKKYSLDKMENLYGVEDSVFRLAVYMDRLDKGFSPEQAALDARKWFIDYDISAPFIVGLKKTILPFVSYTYRVMPLLAEGAILRPHVTVKWGALGYAMNAMGQSIAGEEGDEEIQRLTMREGQNKRMFDGVPIIGENMPYTQIRLPFNSTNGDPLFFDVQRWIPGGDVFSQRESSEVGIPGLPAPLQPGGLWVDAIANFVFKVDPFSGQEIDQSEGTMPLLRHFLKRIPPNIPGIPGTYATSKIEKARQPDDIITDFRFKDSMYSSPSGYWESLAYTLGFKLRPQNLDANRNVKILQFEQELKELKNISYKLNKQFEQQKLTEEEYDKKHLKVEEDMIKLSAEFEIYDYKLKNLQFKQGKRTSKYTGGIASRMHARKAYREGLSVDKDVTDVEDNPANRNIDGTGQSFREVAGQDTEAKTPVAVKNVPLVEQPITEEMPLSEAEVLGSRILSDYSITKDEKGKKTFVNLIHQVAEQEGHPNPIFAATQAVLETGWGTKEGGNLYGIKARRGEASKTVKTRENNRGELELTDEKFIDLSNESVQKNVQHYTELMQREYPNVLLELSKGDIEAAVKYLQTEENGGFRKNTGYATDPDYIRKVLELYPFVEKRLN